MKRHFNYVVLILVCGSIGLMGAFQNVVADFGWKNIEWSYLVPPDKPLEGVQRIAIMDFDESGAFANIMIEVMNNGFPPKYDVYEQGGKTNIYEIIERTQLNDIIKEQSFQLSDLLDESKVVELGKLSGVQAIFTGSYSTNTPADVYFNREVSVKKDGKWVKQYVPYIKRTASATGTCRIILVETGQVVNTLNESSKREQEVRVADKAQLKSKEELVGLCLGDIAIKFAQVVLPSYQNEKIHLIKDKSKDDRSKRARKLADKGHLTEALALWMQVLEEDEFNDRVHFNVGMIYECFSDIENATKHYDIAYRIDHGEKKYQKAFDRISQRKSEIEALAALGINITPHEIDEARFKAEKERASCQWILVKGKEKHRCCIYCKPDTKSKVVCKIPGGKEIELLGEEGEFYKVKDPLSRVGYILKKDAKKI